MKDQFVPYEIALKLKDLGFDEECLATYSNRELSRNPSHKMDAKPIQGKPYTWKNSKVHNSVVAAPLWQDAFDWFRKEHNLYYVIIPLGYNVNAIQVGELGRLLPYGNNYNYEEAREACLVKLIELCQLK